jgi:hypothetical protein
LLSNEPHCADHAWRAFRRSAGGGSFSSTCSASNARSVRKGRYSVAKLIEKYGRKGNMQVEGTLNGDCPRRDAHSMMESCDLICPDLPKVL